MDSDDVTLKTLYFKAKAQQEVLDSLDPRNDDYKTNIQTAIATLEECREMILKLNLYSTNEEVDDIATTDLQYMVVDYLIAELLLKSYNADRFAQLQRASERLESFLVRLDHYDMLSKSDRKLLERFKGGKASFSVAQASSAEERRNIKVARFQEERSLKSQLKSLRERSNANHVEDEVLRNLYLAETALDVHLAFHSLDMISQELSILSQMRPADSSAGNIIERDARSRQEQPGSYSDRLDGPEIMARAGKRNGPLLDAKGKPLQPFTLTDKRTQLQKGVFRPGHNLPTMSIDEYLEEERKRGGIVEGGGNANAAQAEPDEDNMDLVDAATYKAREWDEFVEANPKGAGNTVNRG